MKHRQSDLLHEIFGSEILGKLVIEERRYRDPTRFKRIILRLLILRI